MWEGWLEELQECGKGGRLVHVHEGGGSAGFRTTQYMGALGAVGLGSRALGRLGQGAPGSADTGAGCFGSGRLLVAYSLVLMSQFPCLLRFRRVVILQFQGYGEGLDFSSPKLNRGLLCAWPDQWSLAKSQTAFLDGRPGGMNSGMSEVSMEAKSTSVHFSGRNCAQSHVYLM